ncbi:hypothetical protein V5E97_01090 [Singulisphaera sp. Ch08]|uniref:Uncharacterized protein n=1 Tax=Singulisphaera sp. Ch08 TaxID=3120278 RepID=A0AAU7CI84_9BACT
MRRLLLALLLGLVAAPSYAGDMYYRVVGSSDIRAVSDNGGNSRVVLRSTEYKAGSLFGMTMTRYNHPGSNGQALLQGYSPPDSVDAPYDLQLIYRARDAVVVTRQVTRLGGNQPRPRTWNSLAQDDSFFSFAASDDATGRYPGLFRPNPIKRPPIASNVLLHKHVERHQRPHYECTRCSPVFLRFLALETDRDRSLLFASFQ